MSIVEMRDRAAALLQKPSDDILDSELPVAKGYPRLSPGARAKYREQITSVKELLVAHLERRRRVNHPLVIDSLMTVLEEIERREFATGMTVERSSMIQWLTAVVGYVDMSAEPAD